MDKIKRQSIDKDGYHRISFSSSIPGMTNVAIHRLVYETWIGKIPNGYVIHHKDNNKWNNHISNLEAITVAENCRHAQKDGLYRHCIEWNEDKIHKVCQMMQDNISVKDIAKEFNIYPSDRRRYKNFRNQLYHLRMGNRSWKDVSSQYNFENYSGNILPSSKFRDEEIIEMRNLKDKGYSPNEIAKLLGLEYNQYLRRLINGEKRKNIKLKNYKPKGIGL